MMWSTLVKSQHIHSHKKDTTLPKGLWLTPRIQTLWLHHGGRSHCFLVYRTSHPIKTFGFYWSPICGCHSWSKRFGIPEAKLDLVVSFGSSTSCYSPRRMIPRNLVYRLFSLLCSFFLAQDPWRGYISNYWPQEWIYTWMIQYYKMTTLVGQLVPIFDPYLSQRCGFPLRECCQHQHRTDQQISWGRAELKEGSQ